MKFLDKLLSSITMYRLVVYVLAVLATAGIGASLLGHLSTSPTSMVISLLLLLVSAYLADRGLARYLDIPSNDQSWLITALILFLIIHPATSLVSGLALAVGGAISSASKFVLARRGKHLFNPAALAAVVLGLTGLQPTTWWIGSALFWPTTLLLGLLVVRKIRRFPLWFSFVTTSLLVQIVQIAVQHHGTLPSLQHALFSSPLIFLSTIMLTEPATMPPRRNEQVVFGALVGLLYATGLHLGPLVIYPEVALLIGNIYAYVLSPKFRLRLQLKAVHQISDRVFDYAFQPDHQVSFTPGQYMEWTLAGVPYDSRGNRRTFTIASSPTEDLVHVGIKFYEPASMFKARFAQLRPGDLIYASQLAGNFTLGADACVKVALIAGGIGITPFRSMIKYLTDANIARDVIVLYAVSDPQEFAYVKELREAAKVGVKTMLVVTRPGYSRPPVISAKLSAQLIARTIPDFSERRFLVSGPSVMVDATKEYLKDLDISSSQVMTDHFSGY
jgi:ferredoxin-NADP reductase/Na+-translocating ferredoxin:NAD+ oxidoreductase RnfD subunit